MRILVTEVLITQATCYADPAYAAEKLGWV
jgi:hypothetical protein